MIPSFCLADPGSTTTPSAPSSPPKKKKRRGAKKSAKAEVPPPDPPDDDNKFIPYVDDAFNLLNKLAIRVSEFFEKTGGDGDNKGGGSPRKKSAKSKGKRSGKNAATSAAFDLPPAISKSEDLHELLSWLTEKIKRSELFERDSDLIDQRLVGYMKMADSLFGLLSVEAKQVSE